MSDAMKPIHPWALVVLDHLDFTGDKPLDREKERYAWRERGPRIAAGAAGVAYLQRLAPFVWQVDAVNHPESFAGLVQLLQGSGYPFRVLWFAVEPQWTVHQQTPA